MSLLRTDLRKEIQSLSRRLALRKFKIPDNWVWWDHSEINLHLIEEIDLHILSDIKKLQKKRQMNQLLAENIFKHSYRLYTILERMLDEKTPDKEEQISEAHIANRLMLELFELINQTRNSIDNIANNAIEKFNDNFGNEFSIDIKVAAHGGYDIMIRLKSENNTFVDIQFTNKTGYIHMINVNERLQGSGIGTRLISTTAFIIKELGGRYLGAYITHIAILRIYTKMFGQRKLGIPYEEAERRLANRQGVKLFIRI